jgi:hypothetical protein
VGSTLYADREPPLRLRNCMATGRIRVQCFPPIVVAPAFNSPGARRSLRSPLSRPWPARRAPEWLAITGATAKSTGQSAPNLQALSHRINAITVLCLDELPLEPSRSFHDVLLPRLVLACTADGARVR